MHASTAFPKVKEREQQFCRYRRSLSGVGSRMFFVSGLACALLRFWPAPARRREQKDRKKKIFVVGGDKGLGALRQPLTTGHRGPAPPLLSTHLPSPLLGCLFILIPSRPGSSPSPSLCALRCLVRPDLHLPHLSTSSTSLPFSLSSLTPFPLQTSHTQFCSQLFSQTHTHTPRKHPSICQPYPSPRPPAPSPARPISRLVFVWSSWFGCWRLTTAPRSSHFQALTRREDHLSTTPSTTPRRLHPRTPTASSTSAAPPSRCSLCSNGL
ncbi:hypothetical protein IWZ00DRAFT_201440 [Phyllosticta capitalensis]